MKLLWKQTAAQRDAQSRRLLLVFNGFAMDEQPLQHLKLVDADLAIAQAYHDLAWDSDDLAQIARYDTVDVVAWSLGVWVYSRLAAKLPLRPGRHIAINGTLHPIDRRQGIAPAIFALTLKNFDAAGRDSFYERVCGSPETLARFSAVQPVRAWQEQREELAFLQETILKESDATAEKTAGAADEPALFDIAIIGMQDKIFPPAAQKNAWEGAVSITTLETGHFPFFLWKTWDEILALVPAK